MSGLADQHTKAREWLGLISDIQRERPNAPRHWATAEAKRRRPDLWQYFFESDTPSPAPVQHSRPVVPFIRPTTVSMPTQPARKFKNAAEAKAAIPILEAKLAAATRSGRRSSNVRQPNGLPEGWRVEYEGSELWLWRPSGFAVGVFDTHQEAVAFAVIESRGGAGPQHAA